MIKPKPGHAPIWVQNVSHLMLTFAVKTKRVENQLTKQVVSWRLISYKEPTELISCIQPKPFEIHDLKFMIQSYIVLKNALQRHFWAPRACHTEISDFKEIFMSNLKRI